MNSSNITTTDEDLIGEATDVKRGWPICRCGCKARTQNSKSIYLPGHDARHAGQVARAAAKRILETTPEGKVPTFRKDEDADMLADLPSGALKDKAAAHAARLVAKGVKKTVGRGTSVKPVTTKTAPVVGQVKIGRWSYPVRNAAGLAQRNTRRDGSGEWVAVEPMQVVTYN